MRLPSGKKTGGSADPEPFTAADLDRLSRAGIASAQAMAQLDRLRGGAAPVRLSRPCTLGDGIEPLPESEIPALSAEFQQACREGRIVHFIPASGAATRMGLAGPKALVPFHRYGSRIATPVEEHLREAAALAGGGSAKVHFTVAPEHETVFRDHLDGVLKLLRSEGIRIEANYSLQDPATQTVALDAEGNPFRDASGSLLLRPGGHGSLLRNLAACGAEFAWIRNIDNIAAAPRRAEGRGIRSALAGRLIRLAGAGHGRRPLRVCGMVRNTGEPGGSPFWVRDAKGEFSIRIVEPSEAAAEQMGVFRSATHFNPVDMICALRDAQGSPYRLDEFADPDACNIAGKTHEGRALRALEWPGLWNGGMAGWETVCVEIPLSQFAPVKTKEDLLRAEHQS